jgi:hypothetical protein
MEIMQIIACFLDWERDKMWFGLDTRWPLVVDGILVVGKKVI